MVYVEIPTVKGENHTGQLELAVHRDMGFDLSQKELFRKAGPDLSQKGHLHMAGPEVVQIHGQPMLLLLILCHQQHQEVVGSSLDV